MRLLLNLNSKSRVIVFSIHLDRGTTEILNIELSPITALDVGELIGYASITSIRTDGQTVTIRRSYRCHEK